MTGKENNKQVSLGSKPLEQQIISNFITFFNTIDHMLGVVDLNGFFIEVNSATRVNLGYNSSDLIGKDANIIFPEDLHPEITSRFEEVVKKGQGNWTYPLISAEGKLIMCEISFHSGRWDDQEAFFVVAKDISHVVKVSEARNVSLRILNADAEGDAGNIIRMALEETLRLTYSQVGFFGTFDDESLQLKDINWVSIDKEDSFDEFPSVISFSHRSDLVSELMQNKTILLQDFGKELGIGGEPDISRGILTPVCVQADTNCLVGLGNQQGPYDELDKNIISILWDNVVSRIKRIYARQDLLDNEAAYKNLFNSSRDALLLYDFDKSEIIHCNDQTLKMFGYRSHSEILKKTPLELSAAIQPDGTSSKEVLKINPKQALQEKVYIPDWVHVRKNGTEFHCEVTLSAVNYKGMQVILANIRDISDKIKVESELQKSEQSINLAIKEAELGIWDYDNQARSMTIGKGFKKLLGGKRDNIKFSVDEWLGRIHPDDLEASRKKFTDHLQGRSRAYRCEYRIKGDKGSYKWVLVSGRAISRDENGQAERIVGILMDIDSTRKLSKQFEDARNFLQVIISSIDSILFVKDAAGKYTLINRAFTDKLGLREEDVLGKTSKELSINMDLDTLLTDEIVIKQGIEQTYEQEIKLSDGKTYDYLVTKMPIRDQNGVVYSQVGLATDITHIKKLEKDLRNSVFSLDAAVNGTGSGLWDWNPKKDQLILNDNWFQMLGYTRSFFNNKYKSFGFRTFADFVHPEDVEKIGAELEKHYAGEKDYYRIEIRMLTSEKKWKWILASGKVWEWDDEGNPVRMVGIHVDIDYRVRIEEQLKQALVKAEESDKLKSAFLANMSHEIRTPMNGIIGFLDLLESDNMPAQQRLEYMNIIRSSSVQLLNIVNDIIDISKIESGQVVIRESAFDIAQLIEEIRMQYKPSMEDKHLSFETDCKLSEKDRLIRTDHTKLRQVFSNLVSNAVKFTNEGGIKISCSKKADYIEFCIADTGMGIPDKLSKKVFERFMQADMGLTRVQEGTGLGLSICKAYIEKLGGEIWLEPGPATGSRFFFTVPAKATEVMEEKEEIREIIDESQEEVILVVEDEIYNFLFVEQVLQNRGIHVLHAENGLKAIGMVEKNPRISMVIMDIRMPGIDGYEATTRIKKLRPDLPVVALTALALSGDREKAIEAGCDDYLKKPVLSDELLMIIDKMFSKS